MRIRLIFIVFIVGVLSTQVPRCLAHETPSSGFYVAPQLNAVGLDEGRAVDDETAFTLATGYELHPNWNLELNLFRGRLEGAAGDDLTLEAAGINALRVFRRDSRVAPYLLLGFGAQHEDRVFAEASTAAYVDAGAGWLTRLRRSADDGRALLLRLEVRARYGDAAGGSRLDYLLGLGLQYSFGSGPQPTPAAAPPAAPTPAAPPSADDDSDGVPDNFDRCLGTPPNMTVGPDGCELDSDGDGVANSADDCPDSARGARIDSRGCDLKEEIRLPQPTFDSDSDQLKPEVFAALDRAVETLRRNADVRVEVAGHTDDQGSDAHNLSLSQRRAEVVRRYLVDHGASNTLTVRGYGESQPVADNGTETGRAKNRRVVLRIILP